MSNLHVNQVTPTCSNCPFKEKYHTLEKKTDEKWREQREIINKLKEKIKTLTFKERIPLESNFTMLFYDKVNKKMITYACYDSC